MADVISGAKFDEIPARSNTSRERALAEMRPLAGVTAPPRYSNACGTAVPSSEKVELPFRVNRPRQHALFGNTCLRSLRIRCGKPWHIPELAFVIMNRRSYPEWE
mgnify:CR=1 FL=1